MNATRVKVESRQKGDYYDRDKDFKFLFRKFNKAVQEAGILQELKQREYYESPGRKARRKKKEKEMTILRAKLKDNFVGKGKKNDEQQ